MSDQERLTSTARSFDMTWPARQELAWLALKLGVSMDEALAEAMSELRSIYNLGCEECPGCPACGFDQREDLPASAITGDGIVAAPANLPA